MWTNHHALSSGTQKSFAKFGSKVFVVTAGNKEIALPKLSFSNYYLVSYYVRTKDFSATEKITATFENDNGTVRTIKMDASNNEWTLVSALINSGDLVNISLMFDTMGEEVYVDGFAIHAVPDTVAEAAAIIDAYKEGVLNAAIKGTPKKVFGAEGAFDKQYKVWRTLVSPIKSTDSESVTYASLYEKYYKDYET